MGRGYVILATSYTLLSICGVAWRVGSVLDTGLLNETILEEGIGVGQAGDIFQTFLESPVNVAFLANLAISLFILVTLFIKIAFFGELSSTETQKAGERLLYYVLCKIFFLTWVVQPEVVQIALWLIWFSVLGCLKMFLGLAKDRLERLNASPSATPWAHLRVFSVLVLVLFSDAFWIQLCVLVSKGVGISTFWLLLFEPLSIGFETLQGVMVHGLQLCETWKRHSADDVGHCQGLHPSDRSAAGASWEWKGTMVRNCGFYMEIATLVMALGHCLHIWWLRGLAFQPIDAVLFLNLRALMSTILKRIKGFMRLRKAMNTLQGALPDATKEELHTYDDECAICKEPMGRAKRLPCGHLFHLPCLRSWLDQGLGETYCCPTCRRPLFMGSSRTISTAPVELPLRNGEHLNDAGDALSQSPPDILLSAHPFSTPQWNNTGIGMWRGVDLDAAWANTGIDGAGPSGIRNVGLGRVQMMMRHLAGVGGTHTNNAPDENSWRLWSLGTPDNGSVQRTFAGRPRPAMAGLRFRNAGHGNASEGTMVDSISNVGDPRLGAMVNMVREVLPHISDEIIIQDLRRTNSVSVTVNNLL